MKTVIIITLCAVAFLAINTLFGCKSNAKKISPDEVNAKIAAKEDFILLDVRTEDEYNQGHIPTSKLLPLDTLKQKAQTELPDKNALIIVYCRSGVRSASAAKILISLGYKNVYDMGGILSWPYETTK